MNSRRLLLLAIAIVAVGVFALPGTVSLFSGQHRWYKLNDGNDLGGQIPCEKCHADVVEEMRVLAGPHTDELGYGRFECEFCHRTFRITNDDVPESIPINETRYGKYRYTYGQVGPNATDVTPGKEAHAASTVPCMYCHSGNKAGPVPYNHGSFKSCSCHGTTDGGDPHYYHGDRFYTGTSNTDPGEACLKCHGTGYGSHSSPIYIPPAGGFNLTANSSDMGKHAAHKAFVMDAINNSDMEDANEACIACHTSIPVKIQWTHGRSLEFNATYDKGLVLPPTHFNTSGYEANGTVNVTSYGNYSGGANTTKFPEPVTVWG